MARTQTNPQAAPWAWALGGGLTGLLLALLFFAPATWLAGWVGSASRGHVLLSDARGTVWNGSGRLALAGGAGSNDEASLAGRVQWALRPAWAGVAAEIRADCCTSGTALKLKARWRPGGAAVDIADATSEWPAALLAGLGTPWNTLQPEGELRLSTRGLSVEWVEGRLAVAGHAELLAQRMASRLSTLRPMGSYRITLQGGNTPRLGLETLEGSLQLTGSGQWVGSRLHFSGEASATPEREAALANLLNLIGRRNGPRSIITIG